MQNRWLEDLLYQDAMVGQSLRLSFPADSRCGKGHFAEVNTATSWPDSLDSGAAGERLYEALVLCFDSNMNPDPQPPKRLGFIGKFVQ